MPPEMLAGLFNVKVSIHAPRCRGAMLDGPVVTPPAPKGFQSTPPVAEGRCGFSRWHELR